MFRLPSALHVRDVQRRQPATAVSAVERLNLISVSFGNTGSRFRRMETRPFGLSPPVDQGSGSLGPLYPGPLDLERALNQSALRSCIRLSANRPAGTSLRFPRVPCGVKR
ncbi:hypothetical protein TPA0905_05820 [Streptomyces olivaceus]|nr:hypothetical protein TPA0905_05820 [Streptomyces olivaceus]